MVRGRRLRAGAWAIPPAVAHEEGARDGGVGPFHAVVRTSARLRHASPVADNRRIAARLCSLSLRHGLRPTAVLPGLESARVAGDDVIAQERLDRSNGGPDIAAGEG